MSRDWPCVALNPCHSTAFFFITRWSSCVVHGFAYGVEGRWWVVVSYPSSMWNVLFEICFESLSKCKHRGMVLGSRIFSISCLEMLETSALGLGHDLGLLSVFRFMRWLADCWFICRNFNLIRNDLKSAIGSRLTRLVWYESSIFPEIIFKPTGRARPKFLVSFIVLLSLCRM